MSDDSVGAQPLFDLSGQSIVVTGGGYGLGKAMALGLSAAGANVVVAGRTRSKIEETAAEIQKNGGTAIYCVFDATRRSRKILPKKNGIRSSMSISQAVFTVPRQREHNSSNRARAVRS